MTPLTLLIDTETSGLVRPDVSLSDPSQPHIVEAAALLVDDEDRPAAGFHALIRPDGWTIEPEAERVHGISDVAAYRMGIPIDAVLVMLQALTEKATTIAVFNAEFERKLIMAELARIGAGGRWWTAKSQALTCIMEAAAPIMQLPGKFGDHKFPTLEEAHGFFVPHYEWKSGHRADDDLLASLRVWRAIQRHRA